MKIMVAPMKVGRATEQGVRFIDGKRPRVFSLTEMDLGGRTFLPVISKVMPRSQIFSRDEPKTHSQECPIVLRPGLLVKAVSFDLHKLSDDVPGSGMGNDRWLAELVFKHGRRTYVLYATHTNAGVQRVEPGDGSIIHGPRFTAFVQEIERTERIVKAAIADPTIDGVIYQGDVNMMPLGEGLTDPASPYQMFKRLGMDYRNSRVVAIAVSDGLAFKDVQIFPKGTPGWPSDHGCILANVQPVKRKRKRI